MPGEQSIAKYIRLSLDDAKSDSLSIENQRLMLDRYILVSDMDSSRVLEFVDNGYTGTNFERPAVQELLELVRSGRVNCIIVKDFSRFGRNALETGYFIERVFPLYRVRFISIDDNYDSFALDGDTGGMEVAFKFLINEYYSRDLSMKIRTARREKALRGEAVTKNCVFGYKLDEKRNMIIDPEAAETVRLIFEMYAEGKSLSTISKQLYQDGKLTPGVYKKHTRRISDNPDFYCLWEKTVILSILRDEQYTGMYVAGKTRTKEIGNHNRAQVPSGDWIRIPGHHPAIVSQELFDAIQEQLRAKGEPIRRRELNTTKRYADSAASPLRGKVICGHCRHIMRISSTKNAAFHCWYTVQAPGTACHRLRVLKVELEKVVMASIRLQSKRIVASGCLPADVSAPQIPAITEHEDIIENLQDEKQRLYESFISGEICLEEYKTKKSAVDAELLRARHMLETVRAQYAKRTPDVTAVDAAKKVLSESTLTQELVAMLIDKVLVYPDNRVEIVWKISGFTDCMMQTAEDCVVI